MEVRVDKYLFAMRIYKTRSIATEECKKGRVTTMTDRFATAKFKEYTIPEFWGVY